MAGFVENVNKLATDLTPAVISGIADVVAHGDELETLHNNIADVNAVVDTIIPNMAEILAADTNAAIATTQAGIATTKANEAITAANTAVLSEAAVTQMLDTFDDRYLGQKSTDPVVDNDGNTLLVGALYFNTVSNQMRVWDGVAWTDSLTLTAGSVSVLTNKTIDAMTNTVGADHVHYKCRNVSGSTIAKGVVVTAQGTQSGTDYIEIVPVTNPQTQIALGVTHVSIANSGTGLVLNTGVEEDRNTSAWAVGTILYPNTTGGFTSTKPTTGRYQACAVVLRQHNNQGTLLCEFTEPKYIASTTQAGYVQLNNTLTSTSTTQALTAAQGKVLNDRLVTVENGTVQEGDSVTLTGDVTGTAVFDADGNVSITTTVVDDSHNHVIANVDGLQNALDGKQPLDATLTALAGVTTSADKYIYATAADTFTTGTITSFGRSLVDDANAAAARGTLGLGSIATQNADTVNITGGSVSGITDLAIADGGTGASDAATARTNLGISATNTPFTPAGNIAATNVQAAVQELDSEKAPLVSPALTGTPTAPTAVVGTNTTQVATTEFVQAEIANDTFSKTELTMAIGNINSPLLDMPLKNSLAMKVGVGSATFTRASTATYVDRYEVLKTAAIDEPRFEKEGYLNEGSSTNLLLYSEQFDNVYWVKNRTTVSPNTTSTLDPYGTNLADKIIEDTTASATHHINNTAFVPTAGVTYTSSIFVKAAERAVVQVNLQGGGTATVSVLVDLSNGTITSGSGVVTPLSNGWYRISMQITATSTANLYLVTYLNNGTTSTYTGDGTSGLYIFGAQLEALPFATSYIPTTSATVTRAADSLSVTQKNNIPNTNTEKPVVSFVFDFDSLGLTHTYTQVQLSCGTDTTNYFYTRRYTTTTQVGMTSEYTNLTGYGGIYGQSSVTQKRRIVYAMDTGSLSIYENGVFITQLTQSTLRFTGDLLSSPLYIGNFLNTYYWHYGHISNVRIYDKALTAQEVALA